MTLRLLVEHQHEPIAVDAKTPRFSWRYEGTTAGAQQRSFHIEVRDEAGTITWDSGIVRSADQLGVRYAGAPLSATHRYAWSLTVELDTAAGPIRIRTSTHFETALFDETDWGGARWISAPPALVTDEGSVAAAPVLSTRLHARRGLLSARLVLAAGGLVVARIDGARVSDAELTPAVTDFDRRVQYTVDDVTHLLPPGEHRIDLLLGRGFYGMSNPSPSPAWEWESAPWHDEPCVRALVLLRYADGSTEIIGSGPSWRCIRSGIVSDDLYGGETFDARVAGVETDCLEVAGPRGVLSARQHQPIRRISTHVAERITALGHGLFVADFGRVRSGWAQLSARGPAGHRITLRFGEKLTADGRPNVSDGLTYFPERFQTDVFVLAGTGEPETWRPSFTYHGFRYIEVEGWTGTAEELRDALLAELVHTDAERTGRFLCSSPSLNALHDATVDTIAINLHGIPTDTPTYEKNGWTGDGMLGTEMFLLNFDLHLLLAKWLDDIVDSIDDDGRPQIIAPSPGWGDQYKPSPTWHADLVLLPWWLHRHRGDRGVLERHWNAVERYVIAEHAASRDGIADTVLNDWCSPETGPWGGDAPDDHRVSGTAFLFLSLRTAADIARTLGRSERAVILDRLAGEVAAAFRREFFDEDAGIVRGVGDDGYRQTHNVLALAFDLLPPPDAARAIRALLRDLEDRDARLNTGVLGTKYLLRVLTRYGHGDVALKVATQPRYPGWGFWLASGATTLWEHWKPESRSRSHYFLGTTEDWLYGDVLGVRPEGAGFAEMTIAPARIAGLPWAIGRVDTPFGAVEVQVSDGDGGGSRRLQVSIPIGITAHLVLDAGETTARRTVVAGSHTLIVTGKSITFL